MIFVIFSFVILILSVVIHEVAHGAVADYLGDPTAKMAGRLSLNPVKHLDPMGSVFIPLILLIFQSPVLFGWAKPVPINPANFIDKKYGEAKVALAGPAANFILAFVFGMILRFAPLTFGLYNLFSYVVFINLVLFLFNLIPIPPLDGSHLLFTFLPESAITREIRIFLTQYQFFILIFVVFVLFRFLGPLISLIYKLLVGMPIIF
ncbi:MAG: site-2 protease family protein [Candidatus Nealsonbacteria bacterium]|nr:site-2 protease family protein [Candidatus Nealsonbacteria bacterium]